MHQSWNPGHIISSAHEATAALRSVMANDTDNLLVPKMRALPGKSRPPQDDDGFGGASDTPLPAPDPILIRARSRRSSCTMYTAKLPPMAEMIAKDPKLWACSDFIFTHNDSQQQPAVARSQPSSSAAAPSDDHDSLPLDSVEITSGALSAMRTTSTNTDGSLSAIMSPSGPSTTESQASPPLKGGLRKGGPRPEQRRVSVLMDTDAMQQFLYQLGGDLDRRNDKVKEKAAAGEPPSLFRTLSTRSQPAGGISPSESGSLSGNGVLTRMSLGDGVRKASFDVGNRNSEGPLALSLSAGPVPSPHPLMSSKSSPLLESAYGQALPPLSPTSPQSPTMFGRGTLTPTPTSHSNLGHSMSTLSPSPATDRRSTFVRRADTQGSFGLHSPTRAADGQSIDSRLMPIGSMRDRKKSVELPKLTAASSGRRSSVEIPKSMMGAQVAAGMALDGHTRAVVHGGQSIPGEMLMSENQENNDPWFCEDQGSPLQRSHPNGSAQTPSNNRAGSEHHHQGTSALQQRMARYTRRDMVPSTNSLFSGAGAHSPVGAPGSPMPPHIDG